MQWDATPNAGFTDGEPWIAVNPNHTWLNAQAQYDDPRSVFNHYRRLVELRHQLPVVSLGDFRMLLADDPFVYAYERAVDDTRLLVVANLDGAPRTAVLDGEWSAADLALSNVERVSLVDGRIVLEPWAAHVFVR
ncbi:DUF3459 domain-containing protein [Actinokineospora soli]|uniref:DUF3459 domain-containing protein n=1 Tax=Actinokineospora soli TaxID=1048753 RepID=A0ABW2TS91_9PSEU